MESIYERAQRVLLVAEDLYAQKPDWMTFFREILGVEGAASRSFATLAERHAFDSSDVHRRIQQMLSDLRNKHRQDVIVDPTVVITVRLPQSVNDSLKSEARKLRMSVNKLCISKLLMPLVATVESPEPGKEGA